MDRESRREFLFFSLLNFPAIAVRPPLVIDQGNPIKVEEVSSTPDCQSVI